MSDINISANSNSKVCDDSGEDITRNKSDNLGNLYVSCGNVDNTQIINNDFYSPNIPNPNIPVQKPDYEIEQFWLTFKQSMVNFYMQKILPSRNIQEWSNTLNLLQTKQRYSKIEQQIYNYITLYGIDLLRVESRYHISILMGNIRRWDKIAAKYKILSSSHEDNIVTILLEIAANFIKTGAAFNGLFDDIELYMTHDDYTKLIEYALKNQKTTILDRLINYNYLAVSDALFEITGETFIEFLAAKISGKKLLEKIK